MVGTRRPAAALGGGARFTAGRGGGGIRLDEEPDLEIGAVVEARCTLLGDGKEGLLEFWGVSSRSSSPPFCRDIAGGSSLGFAASALGVASPLSSSPSTSPSVTVMFT